MNVVYSAYSWINVTHSGKKKDTDRTLQGGVVSSGEMCLLVADSDFYSSTEGKGGFGLFYPPT